MRGDPQLLSKIDTKMMKEKEYEQIVMKINCKCILLCHTFCGIYNITYIITRRQS